MWHFVLSKTRQLGVLTPFSLFRRFSPKTFLARWEKYFILLDKYTMTNYTLQKGGMNKVSKYKILGIISILLFIIGWILYSKLGVIMALINDSIIFFIDSFIT